MDLRSIARLRTSKPPRQTMPAGRKLCTETILAKALAGKRQKVILAAKVGLKMGDGSDESGLSRAALHKALKPSLERLQTYYVDL